MRSSTFDSQFSFNKAQDFDLHKDLPLIESMKKESKELNRDHSTRLSYRPGFLRWLRPVLSYDTSYREDQSPAVQPPNVEQPVRRASNDNTREITATLSPRQIFQDRGGTTGRATTTRRTRGRSGRSPVGDAGDGQAPEGVPQTPPDGEEDDPDGEGEGDGEEGESKGPSFRAGLSKVYHGIGKFARMFGDLRYTYRDSRGSRFDRLTGRPSLEYQFGLKGIDTGLLDTSVPGQVQDNASKTFSNEFDTSFQPTGSFYLNTLYRRTLSQAFRNQTINQTQDITFPDVSVNIDGLERRAFLRKIAKSSTVNSAFRRTTRRTGTLSRTGEDDPDERWYDTEQVTSEFGPLFSWTVSFNSGINTTISHNRSKTVDDSQFNLVGTRTESTSNSSRFTARYSFNAPQGISILGKRIRFQSDLTLNLDIALSEDKTIEESIREGQDPEGTIRDHIKRVSVAPRATYNFSRKIQGSLDVSYDKVNDLQRERTETIIKVALEALINF